TRPDPRGSLGRAACRSRIARAGRPVPSMAHERIFAISGDWGIGADSLQWILYRRRSKAKGGWNAVSFVRSTRTVLERCMQEKGCSDDTARNLLAGLPDTFDAWKAARTPTDEAADRIEPDLVEEEAPAAPRAAESE